MLPHQPERLLSDLTQQQSTANGLHDHEAQSAGLLDFGAQAAALADCRAYPAALPYQGIQLLTPPRQQHKQQPHAVRGPIEPLRLEVDPVSRGKEIIKIRAEINEIKNRKAIEKINTAKSHFFEKIELANL